jgi:AcrR family transcriptional regulator
VLTAEKVVAAALALAATDGVDAIGLRSVSAHLKVTPMALYRHVGDAEQLMTAALSAIVKQLPSFNSAIDWHAAARAWASGARSVLLKYPRSAQSLLTRWFELPAMLAQVEALLRGSVQRGLRDFEAVAAANALLMYVLMRVEAETAVLQAGVRRRTLPEVRRHPQAFPLLHEHVAHYEIARFDDHFSYGLETLLTGIEERSRDHSRRKRR